MFLCQMSEQSEEEKKQFERMYAPNNFTDIYRAVFKQEYLKLDAKLKRLAANHEELDVPLC